MQDDGDRRSLFPAGEQEIQEHAEEGEQENYKNPQQFLDDIRVALEAIDDRDDVEDQDDQTSQTG